MPTQKRAKHAFGNLMRSAALATATITASAGFASSGQAAILPSTTAPQTTTLDKNKCLPMLSQQKLDKIISDSTAQLKPLEKKIKALQAKVAPDLKTLKTINESLTQTGLDATAKADLEKQKSDLETKLTPDMQAFGTLIQQAEMLNKDRILATFEKGVTTYSGWKDITARAANAKVDFDGVCMGMANTPVSVTHAGTLTTLDVTAAVPVQKRAGPIMTAGIQPISPAQLMAEMPNLIAQGIYYAALDGYTPPGRELIDPKYDVNSVAFLSTVANSIAASDQIMAAVENAVNGTDMKAVEIAYKEFPEYQNQISDFYLKASNGLVNGKLPDAMRTEFRQSLLMHDLEDKDIRKQAVTEVLQNMATAMSSAFVMVAPGKIGLRDPSILFYLADEMYKTQLSTKELQDMLQVYGPDVTSLPAVKTYEKWKKDSSDPATPILKQIEKVQTQAADASKQIRDHMKQLQQQQQQQMQPDTAPAMPKSKGFDMKIMPQ